MDDLKIIEILLCHCDLEDQVAVKHNEIVISFRENIPYDRKYFSNLRSAIGNAIGRPVARIGRELFVSRVEHNLSLAERNAKTFLSSKAIS